MNTLTSLADFCVQKGYAGRLDELYGGDDTLDDTTLPDYIPFTRELVLREQR